MGRTASPFKLSRCSETERVPNSLLWTRQIPSLSRSLRPNSCQFCCCCQSSKGAGLVWSVDEKKKISRQIDKEILQELKQEADEIDLLLLGAAESGKSTILKQMRIIHKADYGLEERIMFKPIVYANTIHRLHQGPQPTSKTSEAFSLSNSQVYKVVSHHHQKIKAIFWSHIIF